MNRKLLVCSILTVISLLSLAGCAKGSTPNPESTEVLPSATIPPTTQAPQAEKTKTNWTVFTDGNQINDLLIKGNDLWAATDGGVVKWDTQKGTYRKYTTLDGLAANSVRAVVQDKKGNLWFAAGSISRFDGAHWQNFNMQIDIPSPAISLAMDAQGNLLAGLLDGSILGFDGKGWKTLTPQDIERPGTGVTNLLVDRKGNIWAVINERLKYYDGQVWHNLNEAAGGNIQYNGALAEAPDGSLWFYGDQGQQAFLFHYDGRSWQKISIDNLNGGIDAITVDSKGNVWCANVDGVLRYDGKSWQSFKADVLTDNSSGLNSIVVDNQDNIWCSNYEGLYRFDGQSWQAFLTDDGLQDNIISLLASDREGSIWVGTSISPLLSRYDGQSWRNYTQADGLEADADSFFQDSQGNIWIGTTPGIVNRYDGQNWQTYSLAYRGGDNSIRAIAQDRQGNLWFGIMGGITRFDGKSWQVFDMGFDTSNTYVTVASIIIDRQGRLWAATSAGVSSFDGSNWQAFTVSDGLADNNIQHIIEDNQGNIWATGDKGIKRYDGRKWQTFPVAGDQRVNAMVIDHAGNLWFGTDSGAMRYDGNSWRTFTTADGLVDNMVRRITVGLDGSLWFGTDHSGVSRFDGKTWEAFTTANGLASNAISGIAVDPGGNVWFSGQSGISRFSAN